MPSSRFTKICDYCDCAPATLRVPAYRASVCVPCYTDHHGPCPELEDECAEDHNALDRLIGVVDHSGLSNV